MGYLLSGETPDLIRRCVRLVNKQCPGILEVPPRPVRDTPSLQTKHTLRNVWTTALLTATWASITTWGGVLSLQALATAARASGGALAGMGLLEGVWRAEEELIQSEWYYTDVRAMLPSSAIMVLVNCATCAWAFQYSTMIPFAICRLVKDDFM